MSFLRTLFGPSQEEVWRQLCREIGAEFLPGSMWQPHRVQARVADWIVTLDTFTVSTGKTSQTYTRLRAPYVNQEGFRFKVYRSGLFTELAKLLGTPDIEVGDPQLDRDFVIQGNDPERVRALFTQPWIAPLLHAQPALYVEVRDDEGWFGAQFPQGVDELYFQVHGVIKDVELLRGLYQLFSGVLHYLSHTGAAYQDDVELHLSTLHGPGGQVEGGLLLWDGEPARRRAAEALGRLGNPRAVAPLMHALRDPDAIVRQNAAAALGELGDPRAVPALIPLLGDPQTVGGQNLCEVAAESLRRLGAGAQVDAFTRVLRGDKAAILQLQGDGELLFIQALERALQSPYPERCANAAVALAELGVLAMLPVIQKRARQVGRDHKGAAALFAEAIERLTVSAALPRPSAPPVPDTASLPRPAAGSAPDSGGLPRPGSRS